jgi:hypothetical protein
MKPLLGGESTVWRRLVPLHRIFAKPWIFSSSSLGSAREWRTQSLQTRDAGYYNASATTSTTESEPTNLKW